MSALSEREEAVATQHFKSVAIVLNTYFGPFMTELSKVLRERHGSQVHLYCKSDVQAESFRNGEHGSLFASIGNQQRFMPALRAVDLDREEELTRARQWEEKIGVTYGTLAVANRHVGRGYALGGFYHPKSRYANASYVQMLHAYNTQLDFWEAEFRSKGVTLVLADNKEICLVARSLGIPVRSLARARYKNLHYWEHNETREAIEIQRVYDKLPPRYLDENASEADIPPYVAGTEIIRRAMRQAKLSGVAMRSCYLLARQAYWHLRGYEKARGYYVKDMIRNLFRQRRDIKRMLGPDTVTLEDLTGTPYVFYPLHTEPEQSLGQVSPEFFFQLAAIAALSRDLPAGAVLAVKEVPMACGRRPDNFYDQILAFKNVVMLNIAIPGPEVIKRAKGVATIAGTAGLEAALMGKPVIAFGQHNPFNFLPHVDVVTGFAELPHLVRAMFDGHLDAREARSASARFVEALQQATFDMGEFNYFDLEKFEKTAPENAYHLLRKSLVPLEPAMSAHHQE